MNIKSWIRKLYLLRQISNCRGPSFALLYSGNLCFMEESDFILDYNNILTFSHKNIYIPLLFLISVEDISTRNCSAGMEMNMSFSSSGTSKSSRTCSTAQWPSLTLNLKIKNTKIRIALFICSTTLKAPSTFRPPTRKVHPVSLQPISIFIILL